LEKRKAAGPRSVQIEEMVKGDPTWGMKNHQSRTGKDGYPKEWKMIMRLG